MDSQSDSHDSSMDMEEKPCTNCLLTVITQTLLLGNFLQAIPNDFRSVKKCFGRHACDTISAYCDPMEARDRGAEFAEKNVRFKL